MAVDAGGASLFCLDAGGGELDEALEERRQGRRLFGGEPKGFPRLVRFPVIASVEQGDAETEFRMIRVVRAGKGPWRRPVVPESMTGGVGKGVRKKAGRVGIRGKVDRRVVRLAFAARHEELLANEASAKRCSPPEEELALIRYPRPSILASIPRDRHAVIEASAGAGKTFTIEHLFVEFLLSEGLDVSDILVLTYTEKAATELRRRIRAILDSVRVGAREAAPNADAWMIDARQRLVLARALADYDAATITTIHGFMQSVLVDHAFGLARSLDQEIVDGRSAFSAAFIDCLRRDFARAPELRGFLECWLDGASVDALEDLLWLAHEANAPIRPAFDQARLMQAIEGAQALTDPVERARLGKQIKNGNSRKAFLARLDVIANSLSGANASRRLTRFLKESKKALPEIAKYVEALPSEDPSVRSLRQLVEGFVPLKAAIAQLFLPVVERRLNETKNVEGTFDFADMIRLVREAFDSPEGDHVVQCLRKRYRVALIDEFQDTDPAQWKIFRRLFVDAGPSHRLYLVGDPKQAIYGFRGADVRTYLAAKKEILARAPGDRPIVLGQNFRSTPRLILAINDILKQDAPRPLLPGNDGIVYDTPVTPGRPDFRVRVGDSVGGDVAPVQIWELLGEAGDLPIERVREHFGRRIAEEIDGLLHDPARRLWLDPGDGAEVKPVKASDIFILTTSNREAVQVSTWLRERGIPYAFHRLDGLFATAEAEDIAALLAAIVEPGDSSHRLKAWLTGFFETPLEDLAGARDLDATHPLAARLYEWSVRATTCEFAELVEIILEESGLIRRQLALRASERSLVNYLHLFELLAEEQRRRGLDVAGVARLLRRFIKGRELPLGQDSDVQRIESEREAVQIMTMHRAKGLEAAVVFLFGGFAARERNNSERVHYDSENNRVLTIGDDTTAKHAERNETDQERARLLYVALTRARAALYLPYVDPTQTKKFEGAYRRLIDRLTDLKNELREGPRADLFRIETRPLARRPSRAAPAPDASPIGVEAWPEPKALRFALPPLGTIRDRARPALVESYSSIKRKSAAATSLELDTFTAESSGFTPDWLGPNDLPGGIATGLLLHDCLERMPLDSLGDSAPLLDWIEKPEVNRLIRSMLSRHGFGGERLVETGRLLHAALTTSLPRGENPPLPPLCRAARVTRELEFHFPFPSPAHAPLGERHGEVSIDRGYLKGFVDVLFEVDGLVYFLDWKSDILPAFSHDVVADCVATRYGVQSRLYGLALVRMLGIGSRDQYDARFGGMFYCFLRGMGASDAAVHFERPPWTRMVEIDAELARGRVGESA